MAELRLRINQTNNIPEFIMINEAKPKNQRYSVTEAELQITEYNMFSNISKNEGRGIVIYIKNSLLAREITFDVNYQESLWIEVTLEKGDTLLMGCMYRSPNSESINNQHLNKLIREVTGHGATHILITGDFNYPRINWENWTTTGEEHGDEFRFVETLRDEYMYQHVTGPTRAKGTDCPKLLDLILSNEEGMVEDIVINSPLGKSDHSMIEFKYNANTYPNATSRKIFLYDKGDYKNMRRELTQDWKYSILSKSGLEEKWCHLKDKLISLENKYVPVKICKNDVKRKNNIPLDPGTLEAIRKKHRCWQRYMETREPEKYRIFTRQRNKVKKLVRRAQRNNEQKIVKEAKTCPKKFW